MSMNAAARRDPSAGGWVRLSILIAALLLVVGVALFIAYGLAGTAHAQAESGAIPSLTLDSNEPGQLVINWQAPEQAPTDYRIRWANSSMGFLSYKDSDEAQRANVYPDGGVTTLTLNGLTPGEDYKVQMRSRYYNADRSVHQSSGPWTATATFQVMEEPADTPPPQPTPGPTLPAAPTGLTASQVSHDSLTLVWDDPQDENVTGYRVMRGTHNDSLLTIEANTGSTSTEYTDDTVAAETTYFYAVLSLSADGDGPQSSTVNVTTSAEPQVDLAPPPTDLTTTRVTHDSLTLTWNAPRDTTVSGYRILRGTTYKELSTIEDDTKNTNTQYTDSGLSEATTYFYAVNALTPDGQSSRTHLEANTPAELINAQPALSNDPATQTLISNMDRATAIMQSTITRDLAQEFSTGPNPNGYKLSSIDLFLTGYSSPETVKIYHGLHRETEVTVGAGSFRRPEVVIGDLVATMTTSSWSQGHDVYTFTPPANTMLDPNTSYWIVVKDNGNPWFKAAPGEDVTPAEGWTISDKYQYRSKYRWDEDGKRPNTDPAFRTTNGSLTVRINRVNNAATGVPTISGTPKTQQVLTISTAGIQDSDGLPDAFIYQWMRYSADGTTFETKVGTNSEEYLLALADEGKRIRVAVTSFIDDDKNDEGPFLSDPYPADNTITAPLIYTMVSSTGRTPDSNRPANISASPSSQSFTTSGETASHILTSVTVVSMDAEEDEFAVKICEVRSNAPTTSCNDLTPPTSFTAGQLVFNSPSDRTITLSKATTYALVFSAAAGTTATLPTTDEDNEDPISLPGWSIRNRSQLFSNNQWMDRGYDVAYLIAIKGQPTQISQASGRPIIGGNPSVGQILTASTESITVPEGVAGNFFYQWKRLSSNGSTFEANIDANSNQYTLTSDDLDKKVQVEVSFVDTRGSVVGFPLTSPAYPAGRAISTAPLISNTSQSGNSNAAMSTEVAQSFTTGPSPHGYQPSRITIFYDDEEQRRVDLKVCETSRGGSPTEDCWNLNRPGSFLPGPLNFTVPDKDFRILRPNTTYAVVVNVIIAAHVGVTTGNREDTLSSPGWSIGNAYQQNNEGTWQDVSSGEAIRIAVHADVAPNKDPTGIPVVIGTARVGQTLTVTTDDIGDPNGLPSTFTYEWKRHSADGVFEVDIGANSSQYTLTSTDLGKKIKVEVSYTDLSNYPEGPLTSQDYPQGTTVITTEEDDLLVSNTGHPRRETVQAATKVGQVFATGTNPNGYELTSVTVSGNTAPVKICRFETNHSSSPSSNCQDNPSPENPGYLRRDWLYSIVIDPNTVGVTDINEADQTSLPHWFIKGRYQVQDEQGAWSSSNSNRAIRIKLRGKPASPFNRLGQLTATAADQQITLNWRSLTPNNQDVIQKIQYRVKQAGQPWNPDWTDIRSSNKATETHTIRNLTNGVAHTIELRAVFDQDGQTVYSGSASVNATPRGHQTAPRTLIASTAGDGGVTLSWSDPADSTLTGYQYRHRNTSDAGWNPDWTTIRGSNAATTSHTLTGLRKNLRHTFEVRTIRDTNQGPASRSSVTPRGPMPHLQNLEVAADDHQVSLSWSNPGDHGITSYQYRHQAATEGQWEPDWTNVPGSNENTTSYVVRNLTNDTSYTFEVRAIRGLEEGPSSGISANTPDGPARVPDEPTNLNARNSDQGFTATWTQPADQDERAPVTSHLVRYRQVGTSSWQNTYVDCCAPSITGLTNRRHYEVQVAAVNRLGTGPWIGPVYVTPQEPQTPPPAPTGNPAFSLGYLNLFWKNSTTGNILLEDSCIGNRSFKIIWNGPEDHARGADEWAAHINTTGGAGTVTYEFKRSPGVEEYHEINGTVNFHGDGNLQVNVRGRFGETWGTWSPTGSLYCYTVERPSRN